MPEAEIWESRLVAEAARLGMRFLTPKDMDAAARDLLRLQRGLTGARELVGAAYMDEKLALASYLLFYWPVSRAQALFMLDMASVNRKLRTGGTGPLRILDLGAGPAPCSIAAAEWLSRGAVGSEARPIEIHALDRGPLAIGSGRRLAESAGFTFTGSAPWNAEWDPLPAGSYDLVVMGHLLNELFKHDAGRIELRRDFLSRTLALLSAEGMLLFIEPALQNTSREAISLRDLLAAEGYSLLAPCIRSFPCPALQLQGQSCHSEFSWQPPRAVRELARRTGLGKDLLKMTAFVFTRGSEVRGSEALTSAGDAAELINPYRVVSDPMLNKAGRIRLLLCGEGGRFPLSAKPGEGFPAEKDFLALRRSDLVFVDNPALREGGISLGPDTRLSVSRIPLTT